MSWVEKRPGSRVYDHPRLGGKNMPKARAGGAEEASPENAERKGPGRPRAGGENVFIGQSKIYSYLNPSKTPGARPPLQEENSVMYHEVKCQGKTLNETNRKGDEKKNGSNIIEGAMKPDDQKDKESGCNTSVPSSDQNQETAETEKTPLPSDGADEANAKPAQKKMVKTKRGPRRKTQGRTPNRKVTDYYPVRRSSRKSKSELETEERRKIDELITSGKEEGMKLSLCRGRKLYCTINGKVSAWDRLVLRAVQLRICTLKTCSCVFKLLWALRVNLQRGILSEGSWPLRDPLGCDKSLLTVTKVPSDPSGVNVGFVTGVWRLPGPVPGAGTPAVPWQPPTPAGVPHPPAGRCPGLPLPSAPPPPSSGGPAPAAAAPRPGCRRSPALPASPAP
uniref:Lysine methyltransferase 5A n=1 Tax=Anser cygnoides TaxID=8845 RepID=A0A8B9DNK8_ANSCY